MPVAYQDYYEALGVPRDASAGRDPPGLPAPRAPATTRTSTRSRAPRIASSRSPRPTRSCAIPRSARATTGSAPTGGPARTSPAPAGSTRDSTPATGSRDVRVDVRRRRLQRLLRELVRRAARGRAGGRASTASRCAAATTRRCSSWRSRRPRAGASGWLSLGDGRIDRGRHPARRARRSADPACPGRAAPGVGGGPAGRPVPAHPAQAASPLSRRGPRPVRRSCRCRRGRRRWGRRFRCRRSTGTLGSRFRPGSSSGRRLRLRGQGLPGSAGSAGRRPVRGRHDPGPQEADQAGARAVRAARIGVEVRSAGGPLMVTTRSTIRTGTWLVPPWKRAGRHRDARPGGGDPSRAGPPPARRSGLIDTEGWHDALHRCLRGMTRRCSRARSRLRRDLGLNYAGAVLACELLARIDELEQLRSCAATDSDEVIAWTRIV